ncbi:hypothetical protein GA0115242_14522, partial [Streptomyces sp. SolWspMP-5a-2]
MVGGAVGGAVREGDADEALAAGVAGGGEVVGGGDGHRDHLMPDGEGVERAAGQDADPVGVGGVVGGGGGGGGVRVAVPGQQGDAQLVGELPYGAVEIAGGVGGRAVDEAGGALGGEAVVEAGGDLLVGGGPVAVADAEDGVGDAGQVVVLVEAGGEGGGVVGGAAVVGGGGDDDGAVGGQPGGVRVQGRGLGGAADRGGLVGEAGGELAAGAVVAAVQEERGGAGA